MFLSYFDRSNEVKIISSAVDVEFIKVFQVAIKAFQVKNRKKTREIVIVKNMCLVGLLELTADFGVKTKKRKVDADFQAAREEQN